MRLFRMLAFGVLGYLGYRAYSQSRDPGLPAFAPGEADPENFAKVRNAGPEATQDDTADDWSPADEASDESFPASDPPATY